MNEQTSRGAVASDSEETEEELTPTGLLALLVFGVPLILIVLCAVYDFPAVLFE